MGLFIWIPLTPVEIEFFFFFYKKHLSGEVWFSNGLAHQTHEIPTPIHIKSFTGSINWSSGVSQYYW